VRGPLPCWRACPVAFRVGKLSVGDAYILPLPALRHYLIDVGGLGSVYSLPDAIKPAYGGDLRAFMLFARVRLDR